MLWWSRGLMVVWVLLITGLSNRCWSCGGVVLLITGVGLMVVWWWVLLITGLNNSCGVLRNSVFGFYV